MSKFGVNSVAQQIEDENAQQAFKENETFLKTLYDTNTTTSTDFTSFKDTLLLKLKTDLDGITNASTSTQIGAALEALNKSLKEIP